MLLFNRKVLKGDWPILHYGAKMGKDTEAEDVVNEMVKENKKSKAENKQNRLKGLRVYLAGPIDHAQDDGVGWRDMMKPFLRNKGMLTLDPNQLCFLWRSWRRKNKNDGIEKVGAIL